MVITWTPHQMLNSLLLSPFSLSPSPPNHSNKKTSVSIRAQASSLSSPKPLTKRKNHLRPKLLRTLTPKPSHPSPPPPQTLESLPSSPPDETPTAHLLLLQEEEDVEEVVHEVEGVNPLAGQRWFPTSVLDLSLRFAALLAVQTVCAVLLFGGTNVEEKSKSKSVGEHPEEVSREVGEASEFERKVLEIREMAKDARASEVKDLADGNGVKGEVGRRLGRLTKSKSQVVLGEKGSNPSNSDGKRMSRESNSRRKRLGFVNSNVTSRSVPKGFSGSKTNGESINYASGGIRQIAHESPFKELVELHEPREPSGDGCADMKELMVSPSSDVGSSHISGQGTFRGSESGHATSVSGMENGSSFLGDFKSGLSFGERSISHSISDPKSYRQTDFSREASEVENKSRPLETKIDKHSTEENTGSSTISRNRSGRSKRDLQTNEVRHKSMLNKLKDSQFDTGNKSWWLKLPYVLAIFLRRGYDHNGPKGLYSLKMNSRSDDGTSLSYTIAFQDRADATNFCYLLESFFEDLGDVSADIVPLTIQELEEAVTSSALKVIVVRKGQLQLYAGQPLAEVEIALHALLD